MESLLSTTSRGCRRKKTERNKNENCFGALLSSLAVRDTCSLQEKTFPKKSERFLPPQICFLATWPLGIDRPSATLPLAALLNSAQPNDLTSGTELPRVLGNTAGAGAALPVPCLSRTGPEPVWLGADSRTAQQNNFTLDSALPWVLGNYPAECEVRCESGDWLLRSWYSRHMRAFTQTYINT